MTKVERKLVGRLQDLTGAAVSAYHNDRQVDRAGVLVPILQEAFNICVKLLSKYPPEGL